MLLAGLAAGVPRDSRAADALELAWDDCGGPSTRAFTCNTNAAEHVLLASFRREAELDSLIGIEVVVDLQADAPLPAWWQLDPTGCRAGQLRGDVAFSAGSPCGDAWSGGGAGVLQGYLPGSPRGGAGQARVLFAAGVPSALAATIQADAVYNGVRLVLSSVGSTGTNACEGCSRTVCLVLNSIRFIRVPGASPVDDLVQPGSSSWAYWQATSPALCGSVPVRNTTWGTIKSLYR